MSRDEDYRRRNTNAYLERRQGRLDLLRHQQRRTRDVYEALRAGDDLKVRTALGVPPARASRCAALESDRSQSAIEEVYRRCDDVVEEIGALGHYSDESRRELRVRFDLIDLWRASADDEIAAFETLVRARGAELREISDRLLAEIRSFDLWGEATATPRPLAPCVSNDGLACLYFGPGLAGITYRLGISPLLSDVTRQRWVAEVRRIDRAKRNNRFPLAAPLLRATEPGLAQAASRLQAEIESAGRCVGLLAGIALLRAACRRYRASR